MVEATLEKYAMLRFGRRIGVAVSGGADSVALLHILVKLGLAASVLHVNHRLRGDDSDADESFVRSLAVELQIPIFVESAPIGGGNIEQEARRLRYGFFERVLRDGNVDAVATGHNLDDQAETVLCRFLRGSGTAGLAGIRRVTEARVIRPLLDLSRQSLRDFLAGNSLSWREDQSNGETRFLRNRIRLDVLPVLQSVAGEALPQILANTAQWADAEEDYWRGELDRLSDLYFQVEEKSVIFSCESLKALPVASQRRLIRRAIQLVRQDLRSIDFAHVEAIRRLMLSDEGSGRLQIPGVDVFRSFVWLRLAALGFSSALARNFSACVEIPGRIELAERRVSVSLEPVTKQAVYNNQVNALDGDLCGGRLLLRNWRPGDSLRRQGHSGFEKIKSLFQEFQIPLWERRAWPVIAIERPGIPVGGEEIVWTRQFGVSADYAAGAQSTKVFLVREMQPQVTESKRIFPASIEVKRAPGVVLGDLG